MRMRLPVAFAISLSLQLSSLAIAQDEPLGRLFFTPSQRAALDANIRSASKESKSVPLPPPSVTVNGVVTRSDGEGTVWIDGKPHYRNDAGDIQIRVEPEDPGVVELKVQGVPRRHSVRVGQQLDPATGQTREAFETPLNNSGNSGVEPASRPESEQ